MKTITTFFSFLMAGFLLAGCTNPSAPAGSCSCADNKSEMLYVMNIVRKVKPEHVATFRESFEKCKIGTDQEPGCVDYNMYQSYTDSTVFFIAETWKNKGEHIKHGSTDHLKIHIEEIRGINDPDFKSITYEMCICPCVNE